MLHPHEMLRQSATPSLGRLRWSGQDVFYRSGTRDPFALYQVLLRPGTKAEYYVPPALKPRVIVDIGSNIGSSIIYFHHRFPGAKIFGFEPHPDTFDVLQKNVGNLTGVSVFNYALGATEERIDVPADKVHFGGFKIRGRFKVRGPAETVACQVRRLDDVLRENEVSQIDLIKIDCEGAEADVFSTLPDEILNNCQWIVGELHDHTAFAILARLAPHFQLDLKKQMFRPRFRFHACNLSTAKELSRSEVEALQR
ncbi:MAG TPA: FkbM family methyltransferase [Chthoniobacterales bacterium]|nr:FkbM family methyltransferase [Chthoniobacterales bacterium]